MKWTPKKKAQVLVQSAMLNRIPASPEPKEPPVVGASIPGRLELRDAPVSFQQEFFGIP